MSFDILWRRDFAVITLASAQGMTGWRVEGRVGVEFTDKANVLFAICLRSVAAEAGPYNGKDQAGLKSSTYIRQRRGARASLLRNCLGNSACRGLPRETTLRSRFHC
jgi:hypothetical protein